MSSFNFKNVRKQRLSERMTIRGEEFKLLRHNPETDIWVYERTYGQKSGNIKKCIEVIKPKYFKYDGVRVPTYPCDEQFGQYGYCCSINDRYLQEKINFWLANGLQRYTAKNAVNNPQ